MEKRRESDEDIVKSVRRASTPHAREMQVAAAAYDLAEKRILEGTASDTLIREFIKIGSPKEQIEREILEKQRDMIVAKTEALQSARRVDEMYSEALTAFRSYHGDGDDNENIF